MNYIDYLYKQEEIEGDSSDGDNEEVEDFSRDNIDDYKIKENLYNERGIKLQQFKQYYKNNEVIDNEDNEDNSEDNEDNSEDNEDNSEDNNDNNY
jgi:hypothetical protein